MAKPGELTGKQKKFCEEYIFDFNASRAARAAGYSEDTAGSIGSENLQKPEIQDFIKELQSDMEKTAGISRLMIVKEYQKIAFSNIADLHTGWITRAEFENLTQEQKAAISEIQTQTRTESKYDSKSESMQPIEVDFVKIKLHSKTQALDSLMKIMGYEPSKKVDLNVLSEKQVVVIGGQKIEF
jgi:phage terminase small subunit